MRVSDGNIGSHDFKLLHGEISSVEKKFTFYLIIKYKNINKYKLLAFAGKKWADEILKVVSGED